MTLKELLASLSLTLLFALPCGAQTEVSRFTAVAVGSSNRLDTYLSPLNYKGTDYRFVSSVLRSRPDRLDLQFTHDGGIDYTSNPAKNAHTLAGHYDFNFAMMKRWTLLDGDLTLRGGGMTQLYLGFAYNMRNSANNPAQGYASLHLGLAGMATYKTPLRLKKRPIIVSYEARLPLAGIMFSPNYGQSYYELFNNGNYDHNVVTNTIATPSLRQQLTADIPLSNSTAVRVGYLGDIHQAKPNNLKQHIYTNDVIIGFVKKLAR